MPKPHVEEQVTALQLNIAHQIRRLQSLKRPLTREEMALLPLLKKRYEQQEIQSACYCNHLKTTHANDSGKCLWPGCECVCFVEGK